MTTPRRVILQALTAAPRPLTAEQVIDAVRLIDASVHRASVYRTLEHLTDLGILQHMHLSHGTAVYNVTQGGGRHPRAQCRHCGRIIELPMAIMDSLKHSLANDHGFSLHPCHAALTGLCSDCAKHGWVTEHGSGHEAPEAHASRQQMG